MLTPEFEEKLRIQPRQSVALVNAPPESGLTVPTPSGSEPDHADAVIGFAIRGRDLDLLEPVYMAARADRLAWLTYPKPGRLGTDLHREWIARNVRRYGVKPIENVSIDQTWSAQLLRPTFDDELENIAADIDFAWPGAS